MSQEKPEPIRPEDLPALARKVMADAKFPVLATIDGDRPRVRPMSPVRTEGFTVWLANLRRYGKTAQIAANPHVELCYVSPDHDQVRIAGVAETVTDEATIRELFEENALLRKYLGSPDNPELVLYRVRPERVRFMREWTLDYQDVPLD